MPFTGASHMFANERVWKILSIAGVRFQRLVERAEPPYVGSYNSKRDFLFLSHRQSVAYGCQILQATEANAGRKVNTKYEE